MTDLVLRRAGTKFYVSTVAHDLLAARSVIGNDYIQQRCFGERSREKLQFCTWSSRSFELMSGIQSCMYHF